MSDTITSAALADLFGVNEMRNIVLTDGKAREQATRHFFNRPRSFLQVCSWRPQCVNDGRRSKTHFAKIVNYPDFASEQFHLIGSHCQFVCVRGEI